MKRSATTSDEQSVHYNVDAILLDIEGTTTSIKFVKDTLFPYVVAEVQRHLEETWDSEETQSDVAAILKQVAEDKDSSTTNDSSTTAESSTTVESTTTKDDSTAKESSSTKESSTSKEGPKTGNSSTSGAADPSVLSAVVSAVLSMVAADRKIGCLKRLQGHMWRKGYADGRLVGHLYDDVPPSLKRWKAAGAGLFIYSSGSIEAQRLLFGHTGYGDLNHLFSGNFDTTSGLKTQESSYSSIAAQMKMPAARVLFVTDVAAEGRAARAAGMQVLLSDRPGNVFGLQDGEAYETVTSFQSVEVGTGDRSKQLKT